MLYQLINAVLVVTRRYRLHIDEPLGIHVEIRSNVLRIVIVWNQTPCLEASALFYHVTTVTSSAC